MAIREITETLLRPIRVLLVEDNEDDAILMMAELKSHGYDPHWLRVENEQALTAALENHEWDIVFADYALPRFSAPEALRTIQEWGHDIPVIIISGTVGEETAVTCMKAGASDFLLKGHLKRLMPAMERELRDAAERRHRRETEAALAESTEELRKRVRQQEAVAELGFIAMSFPNQVERLLAQATHLAAITLEVEAARMVEYCPNSPHPWIVRAVHGMDESLIGGALPNDSNAQAQAILESKDPIIVNNIYKETRFPPSSLHRVYGFISSASVVILGEHASDANQQGHPFGYLQVNSTQPKHLTPHDARFLQSLANMVGVAIRRKQAENQAQSMMDKLAQSNRELEHFATIASHDLQAPLRKIQLFSNFIRESSYARLDEEAQDYFDRIQRTLAKMQTLIDDLLALSRISRKAKPFMHTDLNQVMIAVRENLLEEIRTRNANLEVETLPTLEADSSQMEVLFQNLVENGLKFQKEGIPPVIRITSHSEGNECEVIVSDNGIGFQEVHAERIFEAFQRLHGESSPYHGSGIGLAICQRIVERHGGTIRAEGHPGEGARFIVRLPIRQHQN